MPSPLRRWSSSPASVMDQSPRPVDGVAAALRAVPDYCEVIDGHLHDVVDQTEDAARSILEQLTKVDAMAEVMAADVNQLAGALGRTEAQLSDVTASNDRLVERLIRYFLHRDEQIRNLVEEMRGLSKHVNQIEEVSRSTNILALNAMIEAVRAGEAGEGFAVVADEVRKLADRSAKAAQGIGSSITDLTTRLDSVLGDETAVDSDVDLPTPTGKETAMTRRLGGIAQAQREMSQVVVAILEDTVSAAAQVERSSDALTSETAGAVGHVQFQDICRQMLEHIAGAVADVRRQSEDVIAYAEGDLPGDTMLNRKISVDELRGRHVMGRQRLTHAESTGESSATSDEPAIELF